MARRTKFGMISVYTDVEIDVGDVLEALTDDDLIEECQNRKIKLNKEALKADPPIEDELEIVLETLHQGRISDAIVHLDRLIHPKFKSLKLCMAALARPVSQGETADD